MRLSIEHHTVYRFTKPQARLVQMLRMTPEDTDDQTVAAWRIDVDCDARLRQGRDGFGNKMTMLYVDGAIDSIEIAVTGEVLTGEISGTVHGSFEPLPPPLFLRSTDRTMSSPAIAAFTAEAVAGVRDQLEALHHLIVALPKRFDIDHGRPVPGRPAAEAFLTSQATPRDLAQIFIAGARGIGAPARYVSGYCLSCFEDATQPTPHGWAEAHVDGLGWIGFDPCRGQPADENYVRVAIGLDSAQAAPVAGSRMGLGGERLDVGVHVERVDEDPE